MRKVILPFLAVIVCLVSDIASHAVTAMTSSPLTASAPENVRGRSFGPIGDNLVRQAIESRMLIFAERVIQDVYWQPRKNGTAKPSLDAVVSQAHIEKKVQDYLRNSPVTPEQLQVEIDRMAEYTKEPEVLQELFEALGSDPFLIAECLARPALAQQSLAPPGFEQIEQASRIVDGSSM